MAIIDPKTGRVRDDIFDDVPLGKTRIVFTPDVSGQPGKLGRFYTNTEGAKELAKAEAEWHVNHPDGEKIHNPGAVGQALQMFIEVVVTHYRQTSYRDLKRGIIPRRLRYRWYRKGIESVLRVIEAEDYIDQK